MIEIRALSLRYPLMGHFSHSLQISLWARLKNFFLRESAPPPEQYIDALNDVNLTIPDGSRVGIIGSNGAGKTTLLRVISGVYPPSLGDVILRGKVSSLTDFTLGMEPNSDGIQNIIFRLIFMGYSFSEARKSVSEIVKFSGLEDSIHLPIRTYSTGMYLRLAFSISTHFAPDILVLDEVIGAGDASFRAKSKERLDRLIATSRILIISSHDLAAIKEYCTRVVWMDKGRVRMDGNPEDVIKEYLECNQA